MGLACTMDKKASAAAIIAGRKGMTDVSRSDGGCAAPRTFVSRASGTPRYTPHVAAGSSLSDQMSIRACSVRWLHAFALLLTFWFVDARVASSQSVSVSQRSACATTRQGRLYCWGSLHWDGERTFTGVHPDSAALGDLELGRGVRLTQVDIGWLHYCGLTTRGVLRCDGVDYFGALGYRHPSRNNKTVPTSLRFESVVAGQSHTCGLTASGTAYCWGGNDAGQTGIGSRTDSVKRPTAVVGGHRFRMITAGSRHTCGITVQGRTLCWGANTYGALGRDPARTGCAPTQACMAVPHALDVPHEYASISSGFDHTCGVRRDGVAFCWGDGFSNYHQQLTIHPPIYPTRIVSPLRFRTVSSGLRFSCGQTVDDRVQCWGIDSLALQQPRLFRSRFGVRDIYLTDATLGQGMRFRTIDAGHGSACGIGQSGNVYCWGAIDIRDEGRDPHDYRRGSVPFSQPRRVRMPNALTGERGARSIGVLP